MPNNPKDRINKLVELINKYNYEYHVIDNPSVEDAVYDALHAELEELEEKYPEYVLEYSPTQRVAAKPLDAFKKIEHKYRMLGLSDVFSDDEVYEWFERISKLDSNVKKTDFWASIKMDGLACAVVYQDGYFEYAITRGDGFTGEDISLNAKTINSIPLQLPKNHKFAKERTEIRGEIVMYKGDFEKINSKLQEAGEKTYANPRNLAAGTMRQLDPKITAGRKLYFIPYDLIREDSSEVPTNSFVYKNFKELGFIDSQNESKLIKSIKQIIEYSNYWKE
jgi:DNA ligase (NAD+)